MLSPALAAAAVAASPLTPAETQALAAGEAVVRVAPDREAKAAAITAAIEIDAPASTVWAVMIDCARATRFVPNLRRCEILSGDVEAGEDVRRHEAAFATLRIETVFRTVYEQDRRIAFEKVSGDLRVMEGVWRIDPRPQGGVVLRYDARLGLDAPLPGALVRPAIRSDTRRILEAVRRESEADAAALR